MEQAVALYRGDFLAQFSLSDSAAFEEWALLQRERLHQLALDALARLAAYHERRGAYEQAHRYAAAPARAGCLARGGAPPADARASSQWAAQRRAGAVRALPTGAGATSWAWSRRRRRRRCMSRSATATSAELAGKPVTRAQTPGSLSPDASSHNFRHS